MSALMNWLLAHGERRSLRTDLMAECTRLRAEKNELLRKLLHEREEVVLKQSGHAKAAMLYREKWEAAEAALADMTKQRKKAEAEASHLRAQLEEPSASELAEHERAHALEAKLSRATEALRRTKDAMLACDAPHPIGVDVVNEALALAEAHAKAACERRTYWQVEYKAGNIGAHTWMPWALKHIAPPRQIADDERLVRVDECRTVIEPEAGK